MSCLQDKIEGEEAALVLALRDYIKICIGNSAKEKHHKHSISLASKAGGFCAIYIKEERVRIRWFKGGMIDDAFGHLQGEGKTFRIQVITGLDRATRKVIRYYIDETWVYLLEHQAMKQLKASFKKKR